jgi:hypothetical protein
VYMSRRLKVCKEGRGSEDTIRAERKDGSRIEIEKGGK